MDKYVMIDDHPYDRIFGNSSSHDSCISEKDFNIHSWRSDCDGLCIELSHLLCRGGMAYLHKYGYIWSNGEFLTKRECRLYGLTCGKLNTRKRIKISEEK